MSFSGSVSTAFVHDCSTEKPRRTNQMPAIFAVSCDCQMFQLNFIPSLAPNWKTAVRFFALSWKRSFLSRGSPCCLHQATTVQHFLFQSPGLYVIWTLWETAEKTRRRSFALTVVVKRCGKFVIIGKSVLYFKSSGNVKSKRPIGGRLWILLESIWLKINWSYCLYNYRDLQ